MKRYKIETFETEDDAEDYLVGYLEENSKTIEKMQSALEDRILAAKAEQVKNIPWGGLIPHEDVHLPDDKLGELSLNLGEEHNLTCLISLYAFSENNQTYYGLNYSISEIGEIISPQYPDLQTLATALKDGIGYVSELYHGATIKQTLYTIMEEDRLTDEEKDALNKLLNEGLNEFDRNELQKQIDMDNILYRGLDKEERSMLENLLK